MNRDPEYVERLEAAIRQMLTPLKNIPFNLVIESLTGKKVIPFDNQNEIDQQLLGKLTQACIWAGKKINEKGIVSTRANEVGNYIEPFVKDALSRLNMNPDIPLCKSGVKRSAGYPDLIFYLNGIPNYLECKTYNRANKDTTQRSFYFSPNEDFKIVHDAHHFLVSYEIAVIGPKGGKNLYGCSHYMLLTLDSLSVDVKYEFNSDNRRLYSNGAGANILSQGPIK